MINELIIELNRILSNTDPIIFFEAGACNGADTIKYAKIFPNAIIYAYEPIKNNYNVCLDNIKKANLSIQNRIKIFNLALSNINETNVVFYNSYGHPKTALSSYAGSLLTPNKEIFSKWWPNIKFNTSESVNVTTLKNIIEQENIKRIDFIHLDTQGTEIQILKGAGEYLSQIKLIWLEVSDNEIYENQATSDEVKIFFESNNYELLLESEHINKRQKDQLWRLKE